MDESLLPPLPLSLGPQTQTQTWPQVSLIPPPPHLCGRVILTRSLHRL